MSAPFSKNYDAIIMDPPWEYGSPAALVGNGGRGYGGAEVKQVSLLNHYETMSLSELAAMPLPAKKNAALAMWITNPMLAEGAHVPLLNAWGFKPKTIVTWAKVQADGITPSRKTGHWFRSASEHFIFAVKGSIPRPVNWPALATWFAQGRLAHSVKPDHVHQLIDALFPDGDKLEMFARRERAGWDTWGNELDRPALTSETSR